MRRPKMSRVISFRVTDKEWLDIERAAANSGEKANDWCRTIALDTVRSPEGFTPNQRLLSRRFATPNTSSGSVSNSLLTTNWSPNNGSITANTPELTSKLSWMTPLRISDRWQRSSGSWRLSRTGKRTLLLLLEKTNRRRLSLR